MPVYAARHPEHVRSIVLAGAYPIDFDPWGRDRLAAARRAIRLVCRAQPACRGRAVLRDLAPRRGAAAAATRSRSRSRPAAGASAPASTRSALAATVLRGRRRAALRPLPAAVAQRPRRRPRAASAAGRDPCSRRRSISSPASSCVQPPRLRGRVPRLPARVLLRGLAGGPPRRVPQRALRALDPRAFAPFSPAGWDAAGSRRCDACIDWPDDPTAAPPLPPGTPHARRARARPLRRPRRQHAERPPAAQPRGRYPARDLRRDPQRRSPAHRTSPCATALAPPLRRDPDASTGAPARAPARPPPVAGRAPRPARPTSALVRGAGDARRAPRAGARRGHRGRPRRARPDARARGAALAGCAAAATSRRGARGPARRTCASSATRASPACSRPGERRITGTVRLTGPGVSPRPPARPPDRAGRGRATGVLGGRPVRIAFTLPD